MTTQRDKMVLISVHIPSALLQIVDDMVRKGLYPSRSEAIRDAIRLLLVHFKDNNHEAQPQ